MAPPSAGTTGGHVAALYVLWGDDGARKVLSRPPRQRREAARRQLGRRQAVADGTVTAGLTDNDDVAAAQANGGSSKPCCPTSPRSAR
jgi:hypothetical protein